MNPATKAVNDNNVVTKHMTNVVLSRMKIVDKFASVNTDGTIRYSLYNHMTKTAIIKTLTKPAIKQIFQEVFE